MAEISKQAIRAYLEKNHPAWDVVKGNVDTFCKMLFASGLNEDQMWFDVVRRCGFGGSDQDALVQNYLDLPADFNNTARAICEHKLLLTMQKPSEDQQLYFDRGHSFEPLIAARFFKEHAIFNCQRYKKGLERISAGRGPHPFMRYSPDDVVVMPQVMCPWDFKSSHPSGMVRILVDYKSPGTVEYDARGNAIVKQGYATQLHSGKLVAEQNGEHIDGMILVQYDHSRFKLAITVVPFQPKLAQTIIKANTYYFEEFIAKGLLPADLKSAGTLDLSELSDQDRETLYEAGRQMALMSRIASSVTKKKDALKAEMLLILNKLPGPQGAEKAVQCGLTNVKAAPAIDEIKMKEILTEKALIEDCLETKFNVTKAVEVFTANKLEIPYQSEGTKYDMRQHTSVKSVLTEDDINPILKTIDKVIAPPLSVEEQLEIELGQGIPTI